MTDETPRSVLRSTAVRRVEQPVLLDPGTHAHNHRDAMTVVPLLDGDTVAGFEVRCGCGAAVVVECLYEAQETTS